MTGFAQDNGSPAGEGGEGNLMSQNIENGSKSMHTTYTLPKILPGINLWPPINYFRQRLKGTLTSRTPMIHGSLNWEGDHEWVFLSAFVSETPDLRHIVPLFQ